MLETDRPLLSVQKAEIGRGDHALISGLDWSVSPGEIWHLSGQNGIGKTTLLRSLVGLIPLKSGVIKLDDVPAHGFLKPLAFLGHELGLHPRLSVRENLTASSLNLELATKKLIELGFSQLDAVLGTELGQLSSGQKKRVQLSVLIATRARLWVLDEPLTALDTNSVAVLLQQILQHVKSGGAVVLTSHQDIRAELLKNAPDVRFKTLSIEREAMH